jgi:hypothetical protein
MSALGQKRTYAPHNVMSALPPIATTKADMREWSVCFSADMCSATAHVCFGPIADICSSQSPRVFPEQVFHEMTLCRSEAHHRSHRASFARYRRTIDSATSAGLSCPSISTVMLHVNCRLPSISHPPSPARNDRVVCSRWAYIEPAMPAFSTW